MSLNRLVLVLNGSYEACNICTAKRALKLIFKGAAVVEHVSPYTVHTSKLDIPIPSVIRLSRYRRMPRYNRAAVSRKGILLRDSYQCQYCLEKFVPKALTLDHVVPASRGGLSTWENLVASCFPCNNRKSNRTPAEAGMQLSRQPRKVGIHAKHRLMMGTEDSRIWEQYLFF